MLNILSPTQLGGLLVEIPTETMMGNEGIHKYSIEMHAVLGPTANFWSSLHGSLFCTKHNAIHLYNLQFTCTAV